MAARSIVGTNIGKFLLEKNSVRRIRNHAAPMGGRSLNVVTDENRSPNSKIHLRSTIVPNTEKRENEKKFVVTLFDGDGKISRKADTTFSSHIFIAGEGSM